MKKTKKDDDVLVIDCWPQLRAALNSQSVKFLGDTPEDVARFLIIDGLDQRLRELASNQAAQDWRIGSVNRR
jgi:hypothetical protein